MRRHIITFLAFSSVILSGCIFPLQENPVLDVDSLHISCTANPEIVDGDLGTESILQSEPGVARGGAGVLIGLDEATYIKHVEVYAASRMRDVRIYVAAEEPRGNAEVVFEPIRDYYTNDSGVIARGQMKKFRIDREVLYLKLLTGWTVDHTSGKKIEKSLTLGYNRVLPMVGPMVREVKFYTVGGAPTPHRIADNDEDGHSTLPKTNVGKDGALMVLIPEGEFQMGDHFNEGDADELPVHTVHLDTFYIDRYEVTNSQYAVFLNSYGKNTDDSGHTLLNVDDPDCLIEQVGGIYKAKSGYEDHPVIVVSWYGATAYAEFYGKRLPTEAEWEKAARGGLVGKRYPWGNSINSTKANYNADSARDWTTTDMLKYLEQVGSFPPNDYGLYDMTGNVWEWCADWNDHGYYANSPYDNPKGADSGHTRVMRGGSWIDANALRVRVADCHSNLPTFMLNYAGFRCVTK